MVGEAEWTNPFGKLSDQVMLALEQTQERLGCVMAEAYDVRKAMIAAKDKDLASVAYAIAKLAQYARDEKGTNQKTLLEEIQVLTEIGHTKAARRLAAGS
jgi:hypothetical protein